MRSKLLLIGVVLVMVGLVTAEEPQEATSHDQQIPYTAPESGQEMYREYCASCHGKEGKGDGPAASALKVRPPDLTGLAKKNRGRFPAGDMYQVIKWGGGISGHGSKEMPVWGRAFMAVSGRKEEQVDARIKTLIRYLESLQVK